MHQSGRTGGIPILGTAVAGNGDELHLPVLRCLAQGPGQLISIDARKSDVHQRGVGRVVMLGGYQTMDFGFTALFDYG